MARLFGENPDNEVAWRKLCEAALAYAGSKGGAASRPQTTRSNNPTVDDFFSELFRRTARTNAKPTYDSSEQFQRRQAARDAAHKAAAKTPEGRAAAAAAKAQREARAAAQKQYVDDMQEKQKKRAEDSERDFQGRNTEPQPRAWRPNDPEQPADPKDDYPF